MKSLLLASLFTLTAISANAAITETKYNVKARYYDENGETHKLLPARAFIRINEDAIITSSQAKDDCLVTSGRRGILEYIDKVSTSECISNKKYVFTRSEIIEDMLFRAAVLNPFKDDVTRMNDILRDGGKLKNISSNDSILINGFKKVIRNLLGNEDDIQTISIRERTVFSLKGYGKAKFVIELEPVDFKILNN